MSCFHLHLLNQWFTCSGVSRIPLLETKRSRVLCMLNSSLARDSFFHLCDIRVLSRMCLKLLSLHCLVNVWTCFLFSCLQLSDYHEEHSPIPYRHSSVHSKHWTGILGFETSFVLHFSHTRWSSQSESQMLQPIPCLPLSFYIIFLEFIH